MLAYITVMSAFEEVELTVLLNESDGTVDKSTLYIQFHEITEEFESGLVWDNPDFIFNDFRKYLTNFRDRTLTKEQLEEFKEVHSFFMDYSLIDRADACIELLDFAEKNKWY